MWYPLIRSALFLLEAEKAHDVTLEALKLLRYLPAKKPPSFPKKIEYAGLIFPSPLGLAAGLDKNGECLSAWAYLGFGFAEVGTVTPKPQPGNPHPRLFRLPQHKAIINRLGFNNKGVDYLIHQLKAFSNVIPIGVNIGKNRDTPLHLAPEDYLFCFEKVAPYASYVTVNLSSPNTPGLRRLQSGDLLRGVLLPLKEAQKKIQDTKNKNVPILVKISPDLNKEEIQRFVAESLALGVDGVIATNTTLKREPYLTDHAKEQEGGLSGAPLFEQSTEVIKIIYAEAAEALPIMAVGGIFDLTCAKAKLQAGAKLLQVYTGFIYQGPALIKEITEGLGEESRR